MRGFDIKQIRLRSFQISGLTAKWGIGGGRKPSIWDDNLVGRWDARTFPDGALSAIPNTATMADRAPDLEVKGATMARGTLQFDGVDDHAETKEFLFPGKFTIFWDVDWLGKENNEAGITCPPSVQVHNFAADGSLSCVIKQDGKPTVVPNRMVALSTSGKYYSKAGVSSDFPDAVGHATGDAPLRIGHNSENDTYTQMGFRQLLIFNRELTQAEVNDVLRTMFPA